MSTVSTAATPTTTWRTRASTILFATLATLIVWVIVDPLVGVDLLARTGGIDQPVRPVAVAVTTVLAGLAGWALLALLERLTRRARTWWTGIAVVVALLSLAGPLSGGVGTGAKLSLAALHLVAAAVIIALFRQSSPTR